MNGTAYSRFGKFGCVLLLSLAVTTGHAAAATPPPAMLQPYIVAGHFEPGDYAWMRGQFADASAADKLHWRSFQDWLRQCKDADQRETQQQMVAAGIADPKAEDGPFYDAVCDEAGIAIPHVEAASFEAFQALLPSARLAAESIAWTVKAAQQAFADHASPSLPDQLRARVLVDQTLRQASMAESFGGAALPKNQMAIVRSRIWLAIRKVDRENTAWLKTVLDRETWVDAERYGAEASDGAWLLVQHADQDPLFQYRVLRALDPTRNPSAAKLPPRRYALLTDRVMLKIAGKQVYGSQLVCRAGEWQPFAIEDAANVDKRRAEMGLGPIRAYIDNFVRDVGKCVS